MLEILKIIYEFENHAATTFEIRAVRNKLGFSDEKSYNSLIAQNGKRIKSYFNKEAISDSNCKETFWNWFFDGEYFNGKNKIYTDVIVGKSGQSKGWALSRKDMSNLIPIEDYEGNYPITVDGVECEGKLNITPRLFYSSNELQEHLNKLAEENPKQRVPLEIEFKDENRKGFEFKLKKELEEAMRSKYPNLKIKYPHNFYDLINKLLEENKLNVSLDDFDSTEEETTNYLGSFYEYLLDNGYYFDKETIENYLLSLKVKPFTILTGNSGTGKTKLSQLFSEYLVGNMVKKEMDDEYLDIEVKLSTILKSGDCAIPKSQLDKYIKFDLYQGKYSALMDGVKSNFAVVLVPYLTFGKKIISQYFKPLSTKDKNQKINLRIKLDDIKNFLSVSERDDLLEINWKIGKFPENKQRALSYNNACKFLSRDSYFVPCEVIFNGVPIDAKFHVFTMLNHLSTFEESVDYLNNGLYNKNRNEYFNITLDLNSFEPTFENSEQLNIITQNIEEDNKLHKIVPVGANWTENRNIIGYYNLITEEYQSTPAYEIINQSKNNLKSPHFLILDEMNLSHVERYFADFLSAIESGENIPLYGINEDLEIPKNLFIIGTVNVDETTYMFSPKVLDRANVLEFETYSSKDYMNGNINLNPPKGNVSYLENPLLDSDIRNFGINELKELFKDVKVQNNSFWDLLTNEIFKFQSILKKSGFDFGFRVINEIVRFMYVAWKYEEEPIEWTNWERYFDAQIKQKLLPKLHGSEKILGDTLSELANACESEDGIRYYTSAKKLDEMLNVLDKQRYVSFIN